MSTLNILGPSKLIDTSPKDLPAYAPRRNMTVGRRISSFLYFHLFESFEFFQSITFSAYAVRVNRLWPLSIKSPRSCMERAVRSLLLLNSLPSPGPWGVAASSTDRCVSDSFAHVRFAVLGIPRLEFISQTSSYIESASRYRCSSSSLPP